MVARLIGVHGAAHGEADRTGSVSSAIDVDVSPQPDPRAPGAHCLRHRRGSRLLNTLGGDEGGADKASTSQTSTAKKKTSSSKKRKTYVVKSGDSFSVIAEKTGVSVEDLVQLNPGVDPQSLRTGQKLKLVASSSSS